jgi:transcriptional regulator GlxA family with amidase domain
VNPRIGILHYPGAQTAAVLGLRDLLETASRLHLELGGKGGALDVRILEMPSGPPALDGPLDALLLPPHLGQDLPGDPGGHLSAWLRARHREGTLLCSVCAGAFLLAETGLLAGRPATTHWALKASFAERFPEVRLDTDRLIVDDGDLMTAGGVMAWVDLGLRLVVRFLGPATMLATARQLLVDPGGREQSFYSTFAPALGHGDAAVLKAQQWLQVHCGDKVDVPGMAAAARLGERTFLRRFRRATGMRPGEYLQHLRIGKAREHLERSGLSIDEIAWRVGYQDTGAFRRTFQRLLGLAPGEYRRRFTPAP